MSAIRLLDQKTVKRLRAALIVTSLAQAVMELVDNSLDATATCIEIRVDGSQYFVQIRDDGTGIPSNDIAMIGTRYATSKCSSLENLGSIRSFGFRGEALASIAQVSVLEVISRHVSSSETHSVILKGGELVSYGISNQETLNRPGTVVTARDMFYRYAVRRKQMDSTDRELEHIRRAVEATALAFPKVRFTLVDVSKDTKLTVTRKVTSTLACFRQLYGIGLVQDVYPVDFTLDNLRVTGFISLKGHHTKGYQYFYVNRRRIASNEVHKLVNSLFSKSRFARTDSDLSSYRTSPTKGKDLPKISADKFPIFVLLLECPTTDYDILFDPTKSLIEFQNWPSILNIIANVVTEFLVSKHFMSGGQRRALLEKESEPGDSQTAVEIPESAAEFSGRSAMPALDDIAHVKTGGRMPAFRDGDFDVESAEVPVVVAGRKLSGEIVRTESNEYTVWVDPVSRRKFYVDSRTGNSYSQLPGKNAQRKDTKNQCPFRIVDSVSGRRDGMDRSGLRKTSSRSQGEVAVVVSKDVYKKWENPVFPNPEIAIPEIRSGSRQGRVGTISPYFPCSDHETSFGSEAASFNRRISKTSLAKLDMIGQVDNKFIAVCLPGSGTGENTNDKDTERTFQDLLILVDQHAADERVRVEAYFDALTSFRTRSNAEPQTMDQDTPAESRVETFLLAPPILVGLTRRERDAVRRHEKQFGRWGIFFDWEELEDRDVNLGKRKEKDEDGMLRGRFGIDPGSVPLCVSRLPKLIADRCVADVRIVRDLVRGHLNWLEEEGGVRKGGVSEKGGAGENGDGWNLLGCPRGIVDLINSKACRGAVMFNDPLDRNQCRALIASLVKCKFPFQCAHGRPSMVPLAGFHRQTKNIRLENTVSRKRWERDEVTDRERGSARKRKLDLSRWKII